MAGESRVAWREGMFLRPQHFQQQDRYVDALVRARTGALRPYGWGLTELSVNGALAQVGKFGVERCAGALPDGTPFAIPDDLAPPEPLDIPADTRDAVVYLTLPARQAGALEFALRDARPASLAIARQLVDEEPVFDAFADERVSEPVELARPNLRYGVTREQLEGRVRIGLARIREVLNGAVIFDDRYIPPALDIRSGGRLSGFLTDIIGRANQRVDELALRAVATTDAGTESMASFLMLQSLNRWTPLLIHLQSLPMVHPERLYEAFVSMGGELATLTNSDLRRPPKLPPYDHEDLQVSFEQPYEQLQTALSTMFDRSAGQLPLDKVGLAGFQAVLRDHSMLQSCSFYLAVGAQVRPDDIRDKIPRMIKVGAVERIREIINSALPGIAISHLPTPPPQIRPLPGLVYFEFDRSSVHWRELAKSTALAIFVQGDWPELKLELWWVRGRGR